MATLSTTREYADGEVLTKAELDAPLDDIETFLNTTGINDDNIQNNGITASTKLLNQSVTESKLATSAVTTNKIADQNVTTAKIEDAGVTTVKIAAQNVTTATIADQNVTTAKIADVNVTTGKLADNAVTPAKLQSDPSVDGNRAVGTNHIQDSAVTTAKIADLNVTRGKLVACGQQVSSSSGSFSTSNTSLTDVTNLSVTITTTGRPVIIMIAPNGSAGNIAISRSNTANTVQGAVAFIRGSTNISQMNYEVGNGSTAALYAGNFPGWSAMDVPGAGTYTYKVQAAVIGTTANETIAVNNMVLSIYEL